MFWADAKAQEIQERFKSVPKGTPLLVRDEKTLSGKVHVGSMRGVVIHGAVAEALTDTGQANTFKYEFNDFDPMDDIPNYLVREEYEKFLGMSLREVPSPALPLEDRTKSGPYAENFAEFFGKDFASVITDTGYAPDFYFASELYLKGKMDTVIAGAIAGAEAIRKIYKEVSGSQREDVWLPINVICPQCRKMTTTRADSFDGKEVHFVCKVDAVEYTRGCGFEGNISPFGGNAKLPWKVEWAAKWKVLGVQVEGAGKDHSTKGGSRDVANAISREVFKYEPPFDVPYEFFLIAGKKMSSSKGRGSSAREIADLMPPKIFRLAMLSKDYNQAFNFDPEGDTLPVLFDLYDKLAESYWAGAKDDYARLFEFIHPAHEVPSKTFLPRFSQVAFISQMLHMDPMVEFAKLKGSALTDDDKKEAVERAKYASQWLNAYAPEKFVFKIQSELPEAAKSLNDAQKRALSQLREYFEQSPSMPTGEELHQKLHTLKESAQIAPSELFSAIYLCFLGKSFGPKAGWFLSVLDRDLALKRLEEATS